MARPSVTPECICLKGRPGEVHSTIVTLFKAPKAGIVTASVVSGGSLVSLKQFVAFKLIRRPATPEEIAELPARPPSIRERARQSGVEEFQESGRSDGTTPFPVTAGVNLQFDLDFSAPQQSAPEVTAATLVIESSSWERIDVPIFFLIGSESKAAAVEPTSIRLAAEPGETVTSGVGISHARAAKVVACIPTGAPVIRLKHLTASTAVKMKYTEEEINEMPPFDRERARKNGYLEGRLVASSDGTTPLSVPEGAGVGITVEFSAPRENAPDSVASSSIIEGTTWRSVLIPLFLVIGKVTTRLSTDSLTVRQGASADLTLETTSVAGPGTDVSYALGQDGGQWTIAPSNVYVPRRGTVSTSAKVVVNPRAPVGTYPVGLEVRAFEGLQFRLIPFQLTVRPAAVRVRPLQTSLVATQGDRVALDVEVISEGGYKRMVFFPETLPGGVRMDAPSQDFFGSTTTVFRVEFTVDPSAPPVPNTRAAIRWSANDGENEGVLELPFTILLRLQSKVFRQPVVTPPGSALGGEVVVELRNDGNCTFSGHMRATGFPNYRFRVRAVVRSASGSVAFVEQKSGEVGGTECEVNPLCDLPRQLNWGEPRKREGIASLWADIQAGTLSVAKSYEMSGVLGTVRDALEELAEFIVADVLAGLIQGAATIPIRGVVGIVFLGSELGALTGIKFADPGLLPGLLVAAGTGLLFSPIGIAIVIVMKDLIIKSRKLTPDEVTFASRVFGDTVPVDRILLTNLSRGDRKFTIPSVDGSILMGLGSDAFDNPMTSSNASSSYPTQGQVFIHELAHAWQIEHKTTLETIAEGFHNDITDATYEPPAAGTPWSSMNLEQQCTIVDRWFGRYYMPGNPANEFGLASTVALNDPYFQYIQDNIRLGIT